MISKILTMLPFVLGVLFGIIFSLHKRSSKRKHSFSKTDAVILLSIMFVISILSVFFGAEDFTLFSITDTVSLGFHSDIVAKGFVLLVSVMFYLSGIYAVYYISHDDRKKIDEQKVSTLKGTTFFGFFVIVWGVLTALGYSANLISFYLFYELMTVTSVMLVIHEMTKEAIYAAKKYLYYSIAGAAMALFGFAVLYKATSGNLTFGTGSNITGDMNALTLTAVLLMIVGFGAKAGMFPLHAWLPSAHPVAPAPASAVLSGVITKAGVLGIFRVIFNIVGASNLKGTWVQYVFIALTLITVFMGSMLAYKENVFKKRLAYSTVSQVSYVLFGIACLNPLALMGAVLHVIFHSILKITLFLNAGTVIYGSGEHEVTELTGIGKAMPVTFLTFSVAALGLVGIPPVCGFVSKWYLCLGAMDLPVTWLGYLGTAVLLISALLTAGYLLSITIVAFFPGEDYEDKRGHLEADGTVRRTMVVIQVILAVLALATGICAKGIYDILFDMIYSLF